MNFALHSHGLHEADRQPHAAGGTHFFRHGRDHDGILVLQLAVERADLGR